MQPLYSITGIVLHGKRRGKALGFPTANMMLTQSIPSGIYVSTTEFNDGEYHSVTFIGAAETFGETDRKAETHILNFSEDLYGVEISVKLLSKLRESERFETVDALVTQIKKDIRQTRNFFKRENNY
ncbi:MAG: riboflavin kinase [Candidatus Roizmanbacteria bacterium]|nr:riboflavin kinase [Candidatus Roizmanbacteria bacterium]